jgi:hypothetical protein
MPSKLMEARSVGYPVNRKHAMRSAPSKPTSLKDRIPFLKGRPERTEVVDKDDEMNLRIALGLHQDVLDLCRDPHLFEFRE